MPKFKETKIKQETTGGLMIAGGSIDHSDFDTTDWKTLIQDYTEMRNGEPIISAMTKMLKFPILQADYRLEQGDQTDLSKMAVDYVNYCLDNLEGGFDLFKYHCLLSIEFGLSIFEKVIKKNDKYNGKTTNRVQKYSPIQLETINKFYYDEFGNFIGIEHEKRIPEAGTVFIDIMKDKLIYNVFMEEFNDVRGNSIFRQSRRNFKYKMVIQDSITRAIQRGAGIPRGRVYENVSDAEKSEMQKLLRTISNTKNAYIIDHAGKMEIDFLELKNQDKAVDMLEFINRELFFSTLTQFVTSGIGQSGSRAATQEHKSSYELVANYILRTLERWIQKNVIDDLIQISNYANIEKGSYPKFKFNSIMAIDLEKVASYTKNLYDSSIVTKKQDDEKYFRELFGMPQINLGDRGSQTASQEDIEEKNESVEMSLCSKEKNTKRKISIELEKFENEILEFENANKTFENVKIETEKKLEKYIKLILDDIVDQLEKNPKKEIELKYRNELQKELLEIYRTAFLDGKTDMKKEAKKVNEKIRFDNDGISLSGEYPKLEKINKKLSRVVEKLYNEMKYSISDKIDNVTTQYIQKKNGVRNIIELFADSFKKTRRDIISNVKAGYNDGRGFVISQFEKGDTVLLYSSKLDRGTCINCMPFDGMLIKSSELDGYGLQTESPINPDCLGGNNCQCVWIFREILA